MVPNLKSKRFHDLATGKIVSVIDQFEDLAVLDNAVLDGKQRINVKKLLDNSLFEEYIDPNVFFGGSSLNTLAEKIRSIPNEVLDKIQDEKDESLIIQYDPEEEKRMLLEKAKAFNTNQSAVSQLEMFRDLIDENELYIVNNNSSQNTNSEVQVNTLNTTIETQRPVVNPTTSEPVTVATVEDPMIQMFKKIKRKNDFSFTLTIEGKIPRPDFIEMMEDSYESSMIDFLADEFTQELINNPEDIKNKIKEEINKIVYSNKSEISDSSSASTVEKKPVRSKNKKQNDTPIAD